MKAAFKSAPAILAALAALLAAPAFPGASARGEEAQERVAIAPIPPTILDAPEQAAPATELTAKAEDEPAAPQEIAAPAETSSPAEKPAADVAAEAPAPVETAAQPQSESGAVAEPAAAAAEPESAPATLVEQAPAALDAPAQSAEQASPAEAVPAADQPAAARSADVAPGSPVASPVASPAAAPESAADASPNETKSTETALAPAPSPLQEALRAALAQMDGAPVARSAAGQTPAAALRREREAISAFYAARGFAPVWISGETFRPAARSVLARIERAREDGLDLAQYPAPALDGASPEAMARAELALSQAVIGYARQASGVRVDPRTIGLITARPEVADPSDALAKVSGAEDPGEVLAAYNPPHPGYRALREKLVELRRERPAIAKQRIAPGPVLRVGMKDPRVPLVRASFGIDASADGAGGELIYDTRVASAVADFQRAHGLPANGALTARTISLLSGGDPSRLEAEILANMERWRWAPRDMGQTRIEVNIPDYRARLVRDGKVVHSMRVIVGKPETPTPVFSHKMEFMVVNPSWHVPQSIIRKQLAQDPNYYARNGYEVVRKGANIFVRQPPGERNALGNIKFMFPNDHAVYMHDTPNRSLFNAARRSFSHGCVRVDQPLRFAEALMPETGWSEQRLRTIIGKGERTIRFSGGVPVHLMYFTAYVDDDGKMQLRDDLYGQSRKLQNALGI